MSKGDTVIVRLTSTTTYHYGREESICGEVASGDATAMSLEQALGLGRRLCRKCGDLVSLWGRYALEVASAKSLVHPDR